MNINRMIVKSILKRTIFLMCAVVFVTLFTGCDYLENSVTNTSDYLEYWNLTEVEFKESCYLLGKGDTSLVWDNSSMKYNTIENDYTFDDLLEYPDNYIGKAFRIPNIPIKEKSTSSDGFPLYYSYQNNDSIMAISPELYGLLGVLGENGDYNEMLMWDCRDNTNSPRINEGDNIDAYMVFLGIDSEIVGHDVPIFDLCFLNLR